MPRRQANGMSGGVTGAVGSHLPEWRPTAGPAPWWPGRALAGAVLAALSLAAVVGAA